MPPSSRSPLAALSLLLVLTLPLAFWRLGATDVVSMEGIVADGARTMAAGGDLSVPRLHGEIYAYKPPMAYWLALASSELFGESEFSLRWPFAALGVLMALSIFAVVGRRFSPWTGAVCGVASLSGVLALQKLRIAEFDTPLAAGVGIAVAFAAAELSTDTPRAWRWQLAYLALLLAFLTKGIPALMFFAPGLFAAAFATGRLRRLFRLPHLSAFLTFCLGVGLWAAQAWDAEGMAAFAQPLAEADDKGLTWNLESLGATLLKPLVLLGIFFPWTLTLVTGRPWTASSLSSRDAEQRDMIRAAAAFVVAGLVTFMAVPATETRYLLPLTGPLGMLCGCLAMGGSERLRKTAAACAWGLGALLGLAGLGAAGGAIESEPGQGAIALVVGSALLIGAFVLGRRKDDPVPRGAGLLILLALGFGALQILWVDPHRAASRSLRDVATEFESHLDPDEDVWLGLVSAEYKHSSLVFYQRRPFKTFLPGEAPPDGAAVVLFSDEEPRKSGGPDFAHCPVVERRQRGLVFSLVRVGECEEPPSAEKN